MNKLILIGGIIAVLGFLLALGSGLAGWIFLPDFIDDKIEDKLKLEPGGETFDKWENIKVPITLQFYAYNITNPDEFDGGNAQPKLQQLGPYVYRQTRIKSNFEWLDDMERIAYTQQTLFTFDAEASSGKEDDIINTINIGLYLPVYLFHALGPIGSNIATALVNANPKFGEIVQRDVTIRELFFGGINYEEYIQASPMLGSVFAEDGTFGYYKSRNVTDILEYEIDTGKLSSATFGRIYKYQGSDRLSTWKDEPKNCNRIRGTDASIFPPFPAKDKIVSIFNAELCRSFFFDYEQDMEHLDIKGYRFVLREDTLHSPTDNPSNECFCTRLDESECLSGLLDMSKCLSTNPDLLVPFIVSTPHFYGGDPSLREGIEGMNPGKNEHETFLDLEKNSGVLLRAHKRIQMNLDLKPLPGIDLFQNYRQRVFPLFWADETAEMDEESADDLKSALIKPAKLVNIFRWILLSIGTLAFIGGIILAILKR